MKQTIGWLALFACVAACTSPDLPQAQVVISLDEACGDTLLLQSKSLTQYGNRPTEDTLYRTQGYFTYNLPEGDTVMLTLTPQVARYPTLRGPYQRPIHRSIGLVVLPESHAYVEGSYD
ncbi:MAG TPA: hypothetical protein DCP28_12100, partial [Cytophagales bacterium]|nr:hypothetical protein [Cytophagales bacterium]